MTRLLLAGATWLVGKLVLEQVLADKRVGRVIALTRRPIASRDGAPDELYTTARRIKVSGGPVV